MNRPLRADTLPRISSGVAVWTRVERTMTLMLSQTPNEQHRQRQRKGARNPENYGRGAEAGYGKQNRSAGATKRAAVCLRQRRDESARRRRGQQPSEAARADIQDVLGIDRHQRRRPSEQHCRTCPAIITDNTTFVFQMKRNPAKRDAASRRSAREAHAGTESGQSRNRSTQPQRLS